MSEDIRRSTGMTGSTLLGSPSSLAVFGLSMVVDAIQQAHESEHFGGDGL